ncbi:MAG: hypothetical protein M3M96_05440 [Candidatus Eremiobacteraeota bacterium]|nr:hypothetical protein [Candidatus Eremiobacteraeota bacterium]
MNMRSVLFSIALSGTAAALAACGGGGGISTPPTPTPGPTCAPNLVSQLIYPNPNGTPAPDALTQMVVAVGSPLANNEFNLVLTAGSSQANTANFLGQITASQLPPGTATTTIPNPIYEAVNLISTLPAATTISVAINDTFSNCTPLNVPGGTFKTQ